MKKILFAIFAMTLTMMVSCSDDDDDVKTVDEPLKLEKNAETIEAGEKELEIKAVGDLDWNITEVVVSDSIHLNDTIEISNPIDTLNGEWYTVIKKEEGAFLEIWVDENKEKERKLNVEIATSADTAKFDLTQNGIVAPQ